MGLDEAVSQVESAVNAKLAEDLVIHEAIKAYRVKENMPAATLEEISEQALAVKVLMVP